MHDSTIRNRERLLCGVFVLAGMGVLALSLRDLRVTELTYQQVLLAALFTGTVVVADRFPIHLSRGTKASMTNLPIFLGAALLPVPLALLVAGLGLLISEIRASVERGLRSHDIAWTSGQWTFITYVSCRLMGLNIPGLPANAENFIVLVAGAANFLLMDFVLFALSNTYILREPFLSVLRSTVREGIGVEGAQYILAILGTFAVIEDHWHLPLLVIPVLLVHVAFKNMKEVENSTLLLLEEMADMVDLRDAYTGGHSRRVAGLVRATLDHVKISGLEAEIIETAARLHDIGKIGLPDEILIKPGRLTLEETLAMQSHAERGASLISKYKTFARGVSMIRHHHERWDGHGYPDGLKDYDIPFGARLIAVADSFDAMTSERPYRRALSRSQAIQILTEDLGRQWDPAIVDSFVETLLEGSLEKKLESLQESAKSTAVLVLQDA